MCGICGQFNFADDRPVDARKIRRMTAAMVHRGPDDEGYYCRGRIGLGFRRLAIIDLAGGHQPMPDATGRIQVVFNGEIYNFPELRRELEAHGHRFRTRSDTEVIVNGYRQWGRSVVDRLAGMFGFAVWDETKQELFLARDRTGIKPVYYKLADGVVLFGSELKAILAGELASPEVDPVSLNLFLRYRLTPSPYTIFKGIRKLAPGTALIAKCGGQPHVERWWKARPKPASPPPDIRQAQQELGEIYQRAVERHLLSDVPLGLLLSGGIDSGLLLALMNRYGSAWKTFTVGYGHAFRDDELQDAAATAKLFAARHAGVRIDAADFAGSLPEILSYLEEPVASSSIVPMYHLCRRAREEVKVALIGQGPDELFGGYRRHLGVRYGRYWRMLPAWLRRMAQAALAALPRAETVKRGLFSLDEPDRLVRYQQVFSLLPGAAVDALFHEGILPPEAGDTILDCWADFTGLMVQTDELGGLQFIELRSTLPDELLMYADKLSMAHSLEVRVPYLDREVVAYAERLPARYKIRGTAQKWLHRQVCSQFLPPEMLQRKKRGFAVNVVDRWFADSLSSRFDTIVADSQSPVYTYLQPAKVQALLHAHRRGQADHHKILFSIVLFDEWLRIFPGKID